MTSRGIRLNNPGNIRRGTIRWIGQASVQNDPVFVAFVSPEFGFRAMFKVFFAYRARGIDTLREIIATWAPPTENDTVAYLGDIIGRTGFHADAPLDLRDIEQAINLAHAITWHEQGEWPYSAQEARDGFALATGQTTAEGLQAAPGA